VDLVPELQGIAGVRKIELWRTEDGFSLSFTGPEIDEVRSFSRTRVDADDLTVISFFEEQLVEAGYITARATHDPRSVSAWTILN
jgi:hypothetical protein